MLSTLIGDITARVDDLVCEVGMVRWLGMTQLVRHDSIESDGV
jgi:hypothetical protein